MFDNHSPSPTPNTSTATTNRPSLDISRPELYENAGPPPHPSQGRSTTPPTRTHSFIHHYQSETTHSQHPRPPENPPDRRSKKMRMLDSEERSPRYMGRSSLSDSSQSDRGDHSDGEQILPPASPTTYEFA